MIFNRTLFLCEKISAVEFLQVFSLKKILSNGLILFILSKKMPVCYRVKYQFH